jgi:hypothetical protein
MERDVLTRPSLRELSELPVYPGKTEHDQRRRVERFPDRRPGYPAGAPRPRAHEKEKNL